ncbi:hypothetical protein COCMIDRAFT_98648 [Bipolaris oryzae ATCC 44560]|uniref:Amidase domain-containing protein n=1 Tax=Bipolaris oryzae ATCC 44560 TaxID=930090 RepID=W6ZKY9_COCMI|nr:uncharacterized protein COCMIDRAFT_98648 [Bipolaris oryzae ATCC 44560]EUC44251.1 hypothetical protein COCMIDRAFT_98648 [Bipolaris oryzae ATCC 44560]
MTTCSTSQLQWQQVAAQKQSLRRAAMQRFTGADAETTAAEALPNADHSLALTSAISSLHLVSEAISSRAVTASQLLLAYIARLTEILFEDALKQAKELDAFFEQNGRLVGPLHGVPMTLKDQFDVKGYDSTLGYVGRAFRPALQDCVLVSMLKAMGAVILAKSNLPQSIMWCETDNPLWGRTVHDKNPEFTPGGSTGGEAALLALQGTVVGWGTDIGGSVRIPSHMNGLYALKPSSTRLPYQGVSVSTEGQEHVPSVVGPMTRNMASLVDVTKAVIDASPWDHDPKCCPVAWRSELYQDALSRPLVIAVMRDDGVVRCHPPIARVLDQVAAALQDAGHEVMAWTPGGLHQECIDDQFYTADGGEDIRRDVEAGGEPFIPHVEALVNRGQPISVYDYWQLNKQKLALQKRYLDMWNSTRCEKSGKSVDVLLTPVMPHSAVPHGQSRWVGYTKVFNFIDYPAVVLPAGQVSKELDAEATKAMGEYRPRNPLDEWNWNMFDLEAMDGMPIGVQVVARRLHEEKVLGAAAAIDRIVNGV